MTANSQQEEAIFHAARAIPPGQQRQVYLRQACGENADLLARLEALLRADLSPSLAGDAAATRLLPSSLLGEQPGSLIDHRYKLLEQIGEGGFGVVFMAEQTSPVKRKVALKVLKPGMDSKQVIARFEAERQALALMDHPNIAKVLDAGATESGRPYFVMELVHGIPITAYCDQARLDTRQRLELFISVCQAVQHAHQKGIIHRDLKPSNVLVTLHDDKPVSKVIDFGIAKATGQALTEHTLFTNFNQMIGTPLYMSPEQAQMSGLDVDTRSDIYSLGVLLYELLTGTTPFDIQRLKKAAYDEIRRIIREEEPPKPSTRLSTLGQGLPSVSAQRKSQPKKLSQTVRGELDWIVMKALEKDRSRRYETANGLAKDVAHYLNDEPVEASPPSTRYLLKKFARRHRVVLSVGTAFVSLLLISVLMLAASNRAIARERALAIANERSATAARATAELERVRAEDALLKARVAMKEVFALAAPSTHAWIEAPSDSLPDDAKQNKGGDSLAVRGRNGHVVIKESDGMIVVGTPTSRPANTVGPVAAPSDYFWLAMAHWQLGHKDRAKQWYEKGVAWMEQNPTPSEEIRRARAEAETMMRTSTPSTAATVPKPS